MRDCSKNRAGYDRVLMAVAATFLAVSATSALAQAGPARSSAAELAIDAAIPRPEPANVPPPTASDFKLDIHRVGARCGEGDRARQRPDDREDSRAEAGGDRDRSCRSAPPAAAPPQRRLPSRSRPRAASRRRISPSPTSFAKCIGAQSAAPFRSQGRTRRGREILCRARICAAVDAKRHRDRQRQGRHRAAQGCRRRRPERGRLSGAGFHRGDNARCARGSRTETDRQHAGLCAPGAERPDALVAGRRRHPLSRTSDRPRGSAGERHDRQGRVRGARGLQSAAQGSTRI